MEQRYRGRTRYSFSRIAVVMAFFQTAISLAEDDLDYFLMDIQADGYVLAESLTTYESGEDYLIDFALFLEAVEFPITLDDKDDKQWSGWFRTEDNHFLWHPGSETLEVDGYSGTSIDSLSWMENDDGVFVSTRVLEAWFDLRLAVNTRLQTITVSSNEPLPFQQWKLQTLAKYRHDDGVTADEQGIRSAGSPSSWRSSKPQSHLLRTISIIF